MIGPKRERVAWVMYAPIAIVLFYYLSIDYQWMNLFSVDYILLLISALIVSFYPIRISNAVFSMLTGISLMTFVIYGLFPEMLLTTVAITAMLLNMDLRPSEYDRYALNLLMVMFLSVISAGAYLLSVNFMGTKNPQPYDLIPLFIYVTTYVLSNHLINYYLGKFKNGKENLTFFSKQFYFSLLINWALLPFFNILLYLYFEVGSLGLQLGFIPFLTFTTGLYMWSKNETSNFYLRQVNEATQRLTKRLNYEETIDCFIHSLIDIFRSEQVYYYEVCDEENMQLAKVYNQEQKSVSINEELYLPKNSLLAEALASQSMTSYYDATEYMDTFGGAKKFRGKIAVIIPVHALNKNRGLILMVQPKNFFYEEYLGTLIENFYRSFVNVIENAVRFESLEKSSYTDGLTELPNFRAFLEEFNVAVDEPKYETISIIVLDLDHFKKLNDQHGHQAGNDVLRQLGILLKRYTEDNRFFARYGGEEFVVLLKNHGQEQAYELAEDIRKEVEREMFTVGYSIKENQQTELAITASLGVATATANSENRADLVALADEAMYLGSKKAGRNRVTVYDRGGALNGKTD